MTDSPLEGVEFSSGSETRTAGEFVDTTHDPDLLYYYIQDAYQKAEAGVDIDADGKEEEVRIHSQIEVFQSSIQYVEAFGIYLLSYIKGREDLLENLIQTRPKQLRSFFESLNDGTEDEFFHRHDINEDYRDTLERLFGYVFIDNIEDDEVSEEEVEEAIDQSIDVLDTNIRRIGEFYLYFHEVYNAVKHGNRALPQAENSFTLSHGNEEETSVDLDMDFVVFICKNDQGQPYLVTIPIEYLIDHSLQIVEKVHRVFNYLKRVSNAATTEEPVDLSFFRFKETDDDPEQEWLTATHQSGVIILPKIEELEELQVPRELTFPARIEVNHRTLYIKTRFDEEPSDEFPLLITILQKGLVGLSPQPILGLDFDIDIADLDVLQYHELLKLEEVELEEDGVAEIIVYDEQADEEIDTGHPEDLGYEPAEEKPLPKEEIEQLALLQKISGERIPVPLPFTVAKRQGKVIERCLDSDLTRDDAVDAVEELREIGEINHMTTVYVEEVLPLGQTVRSEVVGQYPGEISFDDLEFETEEGRENFEEEWGDPGSTLGFNVTGFDGGPDDLVEFLQEDVSNLERVLAQFDVPQNELELAPLRIEYELGEPGFWYTENTLWFKFLKLEYTINEAKICPICRSPMTTDFATHLAEDCELSTAE
ncbi:CBM20 domain-containing protein [Halorussus pelagicus]|uniref:hypothetical protein n=1 Tax=Halorussus pelagicus TaxID=2505977 RepID=UPI000FFB54B9|nr:hypothetical protein [Halorussus pelagicus]